MRQSLDDPESRERRRWMRENAYLYIRHDAHRFLRPGTPGWKHPDEKLYDPYFRYREERRPLAGMPDMSGRRVLEAHDRVIARSGPSLGKLLKLKSEGAALRLQLWFLRQEAAVRKARGAPPLRESGLDWQAFLKNLARYQDACRKLGLAGVDGKAGFNPAQLRVPAGNPDGGQWTSGGNGGGAVGSTSGNGDRGGITDTRILSDATPDNTWIPGAQYAENESGRRNPVVLENEPRFKHIKNDHIGRADAELLDTLRTNYYRGLVIYGFQPAEGSFTDTLSANDLINQTIQANSKLVDQVASGEVMNETLEHRFGYPTGKEAFRPDIDTDPYIRKTFGVRVIIAHDPQRKSGYRLITAFPINERKKK